MTGNPPSQAPRLWGPSPQLLEAIRGVATQLSGPQYHRCALHLSNIGVRYVVHPVYEVEHVVTRSSPGGTGGNTNTHANTVEVEAHYVGTSAPAAARARRDSRESREHSDSSRPRMPHYTPGWHGTSHSHAHAHDRYKQFNDRQDVDSFSFTKFSQARKPLEDDEILIRKLVLRLLLLTL